MSNSDYERIQDNILTMIDQSGYTLEEIAEVVNEMVKDNEMVLDEIGEDMK